MLNIPHDSSLNAKSPVLALRAGSITTPGNSPIALVKLLRAEHRLSEVEKAHVLTVISSEERLLGTAAKDIQEVDNLLDAILGGPEDAFLHSDRTIRGLLSRRTGLVSEQSYREGRIRNLRYLNSALRKVPFEIWEEIFILACLGDDRFSFNSLAGRVGMSALGLSQVCCRWRVISHSIPKLWSRLDINLNTFSQYLRPTLAKYLENLGKRMVGLRLRGRQLDCNDAVDSFSLLNRCTSLDVGLDNLSRPRTDELSFPHLETLIFNMEISHLSHSTEWFWDAIATAAPKLVNVATLKMLHFPLLPYSQLVTLVIHRMNETPGRRLLQILPSCTSLQSLTLEKFDPLRLVTSVAEVSPVKIPSLRHLSVVVYNFPDHLIPLFSDFTFPSLAVLDLGIRGWITKREKWPSFFTSFLRRSSFLVRQLHIRVDNPLDRCLIPSVIDLTEGTPDVIRLEIDVVGEARNDPTTFLCLLEKFAVTSNTRSALAPKLTHFYMRDDTLQSLCPSSMSSILDMIASRNRREGNQPQIAGLETFFITYGSPHPGRSDHDLNLGYMDGLGGGQSEVTQVIGDGGAGRTFIKTANHDCLGGTSIRIVVARDSDDFKARNVAPNIRPLRAINPVFIPILQY